MKKKKDLLDTIDLVVDPRPMTKEERKALEAFIAADSEKNKKRKRAA